VRFWRIAISPPSFWADCGKPGCNGPHIPHKRTGIAAAALENNVGLFKELAVNRIMSLRTTIFVCSPLVALLALMTASSTLASGGGAKKPSGHGSSSKKEAASGHGKKEPAKKNGGHGAAKGHGKAEGHAAKDDGKEAHVSEVEAILAIITAKEKRHDPRLYMEVDLGDFRVTHPGAGDDKIYLVKFHIYGVLHEQEQEKFAELLAGRQQRMRDAVLSVVHKTHYERLSDPSLDSVKSEIVTAINRVLEDDLIRDVAFSTFSMERG